MHKPRSTPKPLDPASLNRLALRYVERFATTRKRLADYLTRKLRERGWSGETPPEPAQLAERLAALGYIDDRAFGEARAGAMSRRGLGARRVAGALRVAGIREEDAAAIAPSIADRAEEAAMTFARRRRLGPFGAPPTDRRAREKQIAAMLRAGHDLATVRQIMAMTGDSVGQMDE